MFIGHFGIGFAAKPAAKKTSLGTLFLASQFIDLLWPSLLLLGFETVKIAPGTTKLIPLDFTHYPISHSMLAVAAWSFVFGLLYFLVRRTILPAIICGSLVASHWLLDALTHRPDLLLRPGGTVKIGLGLWNFPALAIGIELLIFAGGLFLYLRTTKSNDKIGSISLWLLVTFLLIIYIGNVFGPPPPSVNAIAWTSQAQWLIVAWGYWVDKHRVLAKT
jgi:hypothetical protein